MQNIVYSGSTPEIYDRWAQDGYDDAVRDYPAALSVSSKLAQLVEPESKVLDAGCGTGGVAHCFQQNFGSAGAAFTGVDYSAGMVAQAQKKGCYAHLCVGDLKGRLDFEDNYFDAIISAGVFLEGHVGPEVLPELCRVCAQSCIF